MFDIFNTDVLLASHAKGAKKALTAEVVGVKGLIRSWKLASKSMKSHEKLLEKNVNESRHKHGRNVVCFLQNFSNPPNL